MTKPTSTAAESNVLLGVQQFIEPYLKPIREEHKLRYRFNTEIKEETQQFIKESFDNWRLG
jgi:hypothetical protein